MNLSRPALSLVTRRALGFRSRNRGISNPTILRTNFPQTKINTDRFSLFDRQCVIPFDCCHRYFGRLIVQKETSSRFSKPLKFWSDLQMSYLNYGFHLLVLPYTNKRSIQHFSISFNNSLRLWTFLGMNLCSSANDWNKLEQCVNIFLVYLQWLLNISHYLFKQQQTKIKQVDNFPMEDCTLNIWKPFSIPCATKLAKTTMF